MSADAVFGAGFSGLTERERLARCAKELESVVVSQLFATMRKTVPDGGFLDKSPAEDIFRTMLDGELSRVVADRSPFGLADAITRELSRSVPEADPPVAPPAAAAPRPPGAPGPSGPTGPTGAADPARSWRA